MRSHCRIVNGGGVHRLQGKWAVGEDEDGAGIVVVSEEVLEGGGMGRVLDQTGVGAGKKELISTSPSGASLLCPSSLCLGSCLCLPPFCCPGSPCWGEEFLFQTPLPN